MAEESGFCVFLVAMAGRVAKKSQVKMDKRLAGSKCQQTPICP
jgi:hypothetical protein